MKILLVQLSDIHFSKEKHNPLNNEERVQEIVDAIQGVEPGVNTCFILFNGDVAQAALPEEYKIADKFFDSLMYGLWEAHPEWRVESILLPGNHDCLLPEQDALRLAALNEIFKDLQPPYRPQDSLIEFCLKAQDPFWEFEARRMGRETPCSGLSRLFQAYNFKVGDHNIAFHLYNSAWLSRRNETPGQLLMPLDIVPDAPQCDLLISLLHHLIFP